MRKVYVVSSENRMKAEDALKKDDLVSRSSIVVRSASSLEVDDKNLKSSDYFIILDASEEALKKANKLLKGIANKYSKKDGVLKKFDEQEDSAIEGLGAILG